jgi:GNAT superfamily N-acetyltransferase
VIFRSALDSDVQAVARIWHEGWWDGHEGHVSDELLAARTAESFSRRAGRRVGETVVLEADGAVVGFVMVLDDEVEQVYLAKDRRGTGAATLLLGQAESLVAAHGYEQAWLAVVAGNVRARRFYQRCGWTDEGLVEYAAATDSGSITIPVHRYTKRLV